MSLRRLLGLCEHHFREVRQGTIEHTFMGGFVGRTFWSIHQCAKCGKYKKHKSKV